MSFIVFCSLFIQLGISYYFSLQTILLISLITYLKIHKTDILLSFLFLFIFFFKFFLFQSENYDFLRTLREWLFFTIILISTSGFKKVNMEHVIFTIKLLFILLFIVIVIQKISIEYFHVFPRLSIEYYIMNADTLKGIELALEHNSRIRPVGLFGEPSYCAFVLIIFYFIFVQYRNDKKIQIYDILVVLSILMLESMSGILVIIYILFSKYKTLFLHKKYIYLFFIIFFLLLLAIYQLEIYERIMNIFFGEMDTSSKIRLVEPFILLSNLYGNFNIFGIPNSVLNIYLEKFYFTGIDNGVAYNFIVYGIYAIVIYYTIYYRIKNKNIFILFILLNFFNGAVFSLDKAILYSLLFGLDYNLQNIKLKNKDKGLR